MGWVKRSRPLIGRMRCGTRENEKCMRVLVGTVRYRYGYAGTWTRRGREGVAALAGAWEPCTEPTLGARKGGRRGWGHWRVAEVEGSTGPPALGRGVPGTSLPVGGEDGPLYLGYGMSLGGSLGPESQGSSLRGHAQQERKYLAGVRICPVVLRKLSPPVFPDQGLRHLRLTPAGWASRYRVLVLVAVPDT